MLQINPGLVGRLFLRQPLLGDVDGVNLVFSTAQPFLHTGSFREKVYRRGLLMAEGAGCDYVASESGGPGTGYDTITFVFAPKTDDNLWIDYYPSGP